MKRADIQKGDPRVLKLFVEMLLAIAVIEALVMLALHIFIEPLHLSAVTETLVDSFGLLVFLIPILYLLFYRPLSLEIARHKLAQKQLLELSALNESLIKTIPFGMDIVDEEGNILYLNSRFEAVLRKEALGKKCWLLYRDDKQRCVDCPLRKEIVVGETATIETDGVLGGRIFQISHTGMEYQGKRAILEVFQDISERKKAEMSLEKLATAVSQTADIIVITDREGKIEYVNPAFEKQTGYSKEEAIGKTPRILNSGKQDLSFYERLWKTILSGEVFRGVLINKKKDGRLYYTEKTITPIKGKDGNIYSFISTDKDITERKKAEEELLRLNKELLELDRMKSEFINMASHELRTPIAITREGISQVAEGLHGGLAAEQKRFLSISLNNINRLIKIVDSIFDVSEIEYSRSELSREITDLAALAGKVVANFSQQAKNKGLEIKENFPGKKIELSIDKERIKQAFANLIGNAFDFTDRGSIEIKIQEKDSAIECSVSDTGRGIPEDMLPKIFGKFQQFANGYGPGARGVGLGLAITKAIVERHKGKIWVESKPGQGATFTFTLPKEREEFLQKDQ